MSFDQLKEFLNELKKNKNLYQKVSMVATADEIANIAKEYGYNFTGQELKNISNQFIDGVKIKTQDTTPSYNFGEEGN